MVGNHLCQALFHTVILTVAVALVPAFPSETVYSYVKESDPLYSSSELVCTSPYHPGWPSQVAVPWAGGRPVAIATVNGSPSSGSTSPLVNTAMVTAVSCGVAATSFTATGGRFRERYSTLVLRAASACSSLPGTSGKNAY